MSRRIEDLLRDSQAPRVPPRGAACASIRPAREHARLRGHRCDPTSITMAGDAGRGDHHETHDAWPHRVLAGPRPCRAGEPQPAAELERAERVERAAPAERAEPAEPAAGKEPAAADARAGAVGRSAGPAAGQLGAGPAGAAAGPAAAAGPGAAAAPALSGPVAQPA